jgi:succinate dehydrogenase / fumarate reductase cytochrome b subunit
MIASLKMFYSTVGRKLVMALTGLFLCTFLIEHLYGNLLLYKMDGGTAFNEYGEFLVGNIIIRTIEYGLFAGFSRPYPRRPDAYPGEPEGKTCSLCRKQAVGNSTWYSRNMGLTGAVIFVFLVIHLKTFFVPYRFGEPSHSMALAVVQAFESAAYSALYIVSMVLLGAHLNHGFQSAFQTLGWNNRKYAMPLKYAGTAFSLLIMVGFATFPLFFTTIYLAWHLISEESKL